MWRSSSRRCSFRTTAAGCPRAVSSWPTCSSGSTTAARSPRCWRATRPRSAPCSRGRCRRCRPSRSSAGSTTRRSPSQADYERGVERCKEHIRAGDAFQIVLSQRAERRTGASALSIYRSLRRVNPSPYLFLLELDGVSLVGSSPETLVRLDGTRASVNPIAGSTSPGDGDAERLLSSQKDRAEHVMLVDLGRNDLSRVCLPGTVKVERFLEAERFSHITHLVSEVAGELAPGISPFDLLRATFPAGTVSGAPEGAGDADHLGARAVPARPLCRRGALLVPRRAAGRVHRDPNGRPARRGGAAAGRGRDRRGQRPARRARGVPAQARRARDGDRARGGRWPA